MDTSTTSITRWNAGHRQSVLSIASSLLARSRYPLWYLETLVMSARFDQRVRLGKLGKTSSTAKKYRTREKLWKNGVIPLLEESGTHVVGLEFGVASGRATNFWLQNCRRIREWHGFDTFQGLPEPWTRGDVEVMAKGVFAPSPQEGNDSFPEILSSLAPFWHKGLVERTLPDFKRPSHDTLLILIDTDLLSPAEAVLSWVLMHGKSGDVLYFDEAFDSFNEGKALTDSLKQGLNIKIIGFTGSALAGVIL